jgi:transcriptional regulator with XRE-family HTH domain
MKWEEFKKKRFEKDPELKEEYDKLELEYRIIAQIIELRKKKKITQKQLAELVNTKQPSIARLESGEYNPTLDFLKKIAEVLDADLEVNFISKAS